MSDTSFSRTITIELDRRDAEDFVSPERQHVHYDPQIKDRIKDAIKNALAREPRS